MVDPVSLTVSAIVKEASDRAKKNLSDAQAKKQGQVERVVAFLRAISEAVQGLEAECDQLLSDCEWMDWSDPAQRQSFLRRCGSYSDQLNSEHDVANLSVTTTLHCGTTRNIWQR